MNHEPVQLYLYQKIMFEMTRISPHRDPIHLTRIESIESIESILSVRTRLITLCCFHAGGFRDWIDSIAVGMPAANKTSWGVILLLIAAACGNRRGISVDNSSIELTSLGFTINYLQWRQDKTNSSGRNQGWSICEDCPDFHWNQSGRQLVFYER